MRLRAHPFPRILAYFRHTRCRQDRPGDSRTLLLPQLFRCRRHAAGVRQRQAQRYSRKSILLMVLRRSSSPWARRRCEIGCWYVLVIWFAQPDLSWKKGTACACSDRRFYDSRGMGGSSSISSIPFIRLLRRYTTAPRQEVDLGFDLDSTVNNAHCGVELWPLISLIAIILYLRSRGNAPRVSNFNTNNMPSYPSS